MSRDSIVDRHWLLATDSCQRYVPCRQPASDVAESLGRFLVRAVHARGNYFELIPTVKMESRHPYRDHLVIFGNEFPSIYNHRRVMMAGIWKTLKTIFFAFFWKNDPLRENFQNSVP